MESSIKITKGQIQDYVSDSTQLLLDNINVIPWVSGTYNENKLVTKEINDQVYLFKSIIDNNTTIPLLNSTKEAWSLAPYGGTFVGTWSSGTYNVGNIVNRDGYVYYCLTQNNTDPILLSPPDWIKLGAYAGTYTSGSDYNNESVVVDGSNIIHISNYDNNPYPLNYGVVSNWELINGQPNTIVCWGDSLTFGTYSTGNNSYPSQLKLSSGINVDNEGVPGETSTQIKTRFNAAPEKHKFPTIFWVGRNNYGDPDTVKADIAEMVSKLDHDRYLVIGIIKASSDGAGPIEALNDDLEGIYEDKFLNAQDFLFQIYNQSIPQDIADHAAGKIAGSLRSDWLHLNNLGYYYVSKLILSKLNYLLGSEYGSFKNIDIDGLRITGNSASTAKTEGLEIGYRKDLGKIFLDGRNRKTDEIIEISLGFSLGSKVKLVENGGTLNIGNLSAWSSGSVNRLVVKTDTGEIQFAPSIGAGVVPFQNASGLFGGTTLTFNSNELAVNDSNPEGGYKFQVNGPVKFGTSGSVGVYIGSLDTDWAYIQPRTSIAKGLRIFSEKLIISPNVETDTGERLQVAGEIKASPGILSSSVAVMSQLNTKLTKATGSGEYQIYGTQPDGSTFMYEFPTPSFDTSWGTAAFGTEIVARSFDTITLSDTNNATPSSKLTKNYVDNSTGWAQYNDGLYTSGSPLVVNQGSTVTLTNNISSSITSQLPSGSSGFYNSSTSKITPQSDGDFYIVNVRFNASSTVNDGLLDLSIDIGGTQNIIVTETKSLRKGSGQSQSMNLNFTVYASTTFISNGGLLKLSSISGNTSIWGITYIISLTHRAK